MNTTRLSLRGTSAPGLRLGALFGFCALSLVFTLALTASTSGASGAATLRTAAKHKPSSAKSTLGLPSVPVQARAEVARPRRIERRSAGGLLRWHAAEFWWHAAEFWWLRRLRRQFESPSRTQAMCEISAKGRVPGRSRWSLQHGVRLLSQLHEAPWCHRAIDHSGFEHVDPEHRRHFFAYLSGRPDRLQGLAPDGSGHHAGEFGLRGSRLANPSRLSDSLKGHP